jgi:hypothetical protein
LLTQSLGERGRHFPQRLLSEVSFRGQTGQTHGEAKLVRHDGEFPYLESQFLSDAAAGIVGHLAQAAHLIQDGCSSALQTGELAEPRHQDNSRENGGFSYPGV